MFFSTDCLLKKQMGKGKKKGQQPLLCWRGIRGAEGFYEPYAVVSKAA